MSGNFIYHHHVEPRVKLYSPREESFPIPLKYIDVSRTTHTNLDVKQERRIDDGQGDGVPQGMSSTGGGGLARVPNLRVCKHLASGWHTQGEKDELTSCRGYRLVGVAIPPVSRKGGRTGLPKKGKWSPRGTGTTVLTYPCPSQPCFGGCKECARVTGKASENGQYSGEVGGSSPWTRPSAPECGDTLRALAGDQRPL